MPALAARTTDVDQRQELAEAIARRDVILRRMATVTLACRDAEVAVAQAQADLDSLAEAEAADWARWAEHRGAHPIDVTPRRAELLAVHAAAAKKASAAHAAHAEAEAVALRDLPAAQERIQAAVRAVLLEEAQTLGQRYSQAVEAATRLEAALEGIKNSFAGNFGDGVAVVTVCLQGNMTPDGAMRRRQVVAKESAVIMDSWRRLAARLANDPDAVAEDPAP